MADTSIFKSKVLGWVSLAVCLLYAQSFLCASGNPSSAGQPAANELPRPPEKLIFLRLSFSSVFFTFPRSKFTMSTLDPFAIIKAKAGSSTTPEAAGSSTVPDDDTVMISPTKAEQEDLNSWSNAAIKAAEARNAENAGSSDYEGDEGHEVHEVNDNPVAVDSDVIIDDEFESAEDEEEEARRQDRLSFLEKLQ
jgi:hypothetical protein